MTDIDLKMEMGEEAFSLLSADEVNWILGKYQDAVSGATKGFELLWKKFKPSYRLGRMYKAESDRYEAYYKIYCDYVRSASAGRSVQVTDDGDVESWK